MFSLILHFGRHPHPAPPPGYATGCGHVLRKEDENVIVMTLKIEVSGSRGRPKQTWKKQAENEMKKNGLVKEDACDRTKWRGVVQRQ